MKGENGKVKGDFATFTEGFTCPHPLIFNKFLSFFLIYLHILLFFRTFAAEIVCKQMPAKNTDYPKQG